MPKCESVTFLSSRTKLCVTSATILDCLKENYSDISLWDNGSIQSELPLNDTVGKQLQRNYLGVWGTRKSPVEAVVTGRVLQTEAGFMSLCHSGVRAGIQQVIVAELIHAVVVPEITGKILFIAAEMSGYDYITCKSRKRCETDKVSVEV